VGVALPAHRSRILYSAAAHVQRRAGASLFASALCTLLLVVALAPLVCLLRSPATRERIAVLLAVGASEVWYQCSRAGQPRMAAVDGDGAVRGFGEAGLSCGCPSLHVGSESKLASSSNCDSFGVDTPTGLRRRLHCVSGGKRHHAW